jgi:Carboxypeptidase regulatory-like domain
VTSTVRHQLVLAGHVVDGELGTPLAGARVHLVALPAPFEQWVARHAVAYGAVWDDLDERPDRTRTDARGRFMFVDLPSGSYGLTASLPAGGSRYGTRTETAQVVRDELGGAELTMLELTLPATCVAGTVTDAQSKPLVLATVTIADGSASTLTDAQGRYALRGVETGRRSIVARSRGFKPATAAVDLTEAGTTKTLDFVLDPAQ